MRIHTHAFVLALLAAGSGVVTAAMAAPVAPSAPASTGTAAPATPAASATPAAPPTALANQPALKPSSAGMAIGAPLYPSVRTPTSTIGFVKPTNGLGVQQLPKDFVIVADFNGQAPLSSLTLHEGRMYGTKASNYTGPGAVYRYTPGKYASDMGTVDILRPFPNGGLSYKDLVVASSTDAVFGNTQSGGAYGAGFLYRIAKDGSYKVVHDYRKESQTWDSMPGAWMFTSADNLFAVTHKALTKKTPGDDIELRANLPEWTSDGVSITRAPDGTVFFSTFWGACNMSTTPGHIGYGALLELRPNHSAIKCLHDADGPKRGSFGSLIALDEDTVFGTMEGDASASKNGGIFKWKRGDGMKVIHVFDQETEGTWGRMTRGPDGNFYGTTVKIWNAAGQLTAGLGILWKMTPGGAFSTLHKFSCGADGCLPHGVVVHDGYLYGVVAQGGKYGEGGIFRYKLP